MMGNGGYFHQDPSYYPQQNQVNNNRMNSNNNADNNDNQQNPPGHTWVQIVKKNIMLSWIHEMCTWVLMIPFVWV